MKYPILLIISAFILTTSFIACNSDEIPEFNSLDEKIDYLIEQNRYEDALNELQNEDSENPEIRVLLEKTHLNYGLHNMNTFDETEMRTRMNEALRQFTEVLRINPANEVAQNQISQILQIYDTIPDRQPEDDVIAGLREVGFNI
jgi:tetratricopeptide (TPR) repeat protein